MPQRQKRALKSWIKLFFRVLDQFLRGYAAAGALSKALEQPDRCPAHPRGVSLVAFPVLQAEAKHPLKLGKIVSDQSQIVRPGNGGDHQIVRSDHLAGLLEFCSDPAVLLGCGIVEGHSKAFGERSFHLVLFHFPEWGLVSHSVQAPWQLVPAQVTLIFKTERVARMRKATHCRQ